MPGESTTDLAFAGQRIKLRVLVTLTVCSVILIVLLVAVTFALAIPALDRGETLKVGLLALLGGVAIIAMAAGGYLVWDIGHTMAHLAEAMASGQPVAGVERRHDGAGALMQAFNKVLGTIEQQAAEVNSYASRLDASYKELESTNARLKETSFKDDVTGLYNRRFFSLRLEEELSRYRRFNHPVSVVLLDLDGFKAVNDEFGHAVGDDTLRDIAQILMKHSRGINVVSRYGGDEFAVLLVETSKAGARLYADRIREVVAKYPFSHGKVITASFGVASLPDDEAATAEDLFRAADDALYTAKRGGKNQVAATGSAEKVL
jgi:diguanylate cyclase (GGDEF)-like protein